MSLTGILNSVKAWLAPVPPDAHPAVDAPPAADQDETVAATRGLDIKEDKGNG